MVFIYVEVAFLVVLSWALAFMLLRGVRQQRDAANALAKRRSELLKEAQAQLLEARKQIEHLRHTAAASGAGETNALLGEMERDIEAGATVVDDLTDANSQCQASVDRLEQMGNDTATLSQELLMKELVLLREQHARSGGVISNLSRALERNKERLRELERSAKTSGIQASSDLDGQYRQLMQENKTLHTRIQKAADSHQAALERITEQLRASEEKYRVHVAEAKFQKEQMDAIINSLRQQLREADGQQMDATRIEELLAQVQQMEDELGRALRERDFLDARFVEIEQALSTSENAVQELERTKVEYKMLEQRYLEMEEAINNTIKERKAKERKLTDIEELPEIEYSEKGFDAVDDDMTDLL